MFHDVAFIEAKPIITYGMISGGGGRTFAIFFIRKAPNGRHRIDRLFGLLLARFHLHAEQALKNKGSKIVVEKGQVVKVSKDADGIVSREVLTKHWTDWIDYWSVDFDFESKQEIIRMQDSQTGEWEEQWTGDYVFENEWQSFRTKKDRSLEPISVAHECTPGPRKLAVKVVDIFGNDTMTIVEVTI